MSVLNSLENCENCKIFFHPNYILIQKSTCINANYFIFNSFRAPTTSFYYVPIICACLYYFCACAYILRAWLYVVVPQNYLFNSGFSHSTHQSVKSHALYYYLGLLIYLVQKISKMSTLAAVELAHRRRVLAVIRPQK